MLTTSTIGRAFSGLLALTVITTGCTQPEPSAPNTSSTTSSVPTADDILQYSNRWIQNPNIDLMSPEGTFVRAAVESLDRVGYGRGSGIKAIEDAGYPGFSHAFNNVKDPDIFGLPGGKDRDQVGTMYWEVVATHRNGDLVTAGVCAYGSMVAAKEYGGGYRSSGRQLPAGSARWITFGPDQALPGTQQVAPPSNQRGPRRTPKVNVFGTWVITDYKVLGADTDLPQCSSTLAPGTPPGAPNDYFVQPEPLPTLPPDPGWPES
ncbi:hypothetical protein [Mycolicibacterium neworleansense]|uniref:Uncharacterized protein n=1 Tax=Mycolicibacterium neworleansense TaxID=146018 RepID=A0A0H5RVN3_9MYCO|nr:hypothetical protein [Mycolicibacterium neworleansense]CRZ17836.1 hypothetical protein BN2156_04731 [Mycolicibacterium neworleansense]